MINRRIKDGNEGCINPPRCLLRAPAKYEPPSNGRSLPANSNLQQSLPKQLTISMKYHTY